MKFNFSKLFKSIVLIDLVISGLFFSIDVFSAKKDSATNINFDDLMVDGQYHFNNEIVTTVEEDKVLNSMIGVRTDFKDRIKQSSTLGEVKTK